MLLNAPSKLRNPSETETSILPLTHSDVEVNHVANIAQNMELMIFIGHV